jgi:hypothetical protein
MQVWLVFDNSKAETQVVAVFAHAPSAEELASLGPLRQDFANVLDAHGQPHTTRVVECWDVRP